jgi:hypothetical protein
MEENLTQSRLRPISPFSYVGQGSKGKREIRNSRKRHKTHKKVDLKFGKRTFSAALWIDGYHTTVVLQFSFFELFAPFRLCGFA